MDEVVEALEKYHGLVPLVYDIETMGLDEARPQEMYYAVYLKREADKVIANKDYEIKKLKDSVDRLLKAKTEQIIHEIMQKTLIYGEGFVRVEDAMKLVAELRHNKYKRCLAMAKICQLCLEHYERYLMEHKGCDGLCIVERWWFLKNHYEKWYKRWMQISKKFKEAK